MPLSRKHRRAITIGRRLQNDRTDIRAAENENEETVPIACNSCSHASVDVDPTYTIHGLPVVPGDAYVARLWTCKACKKRSYSTPTDGRRYTYLTKLPRCEPRRNTPPRPKGDVSTAQSDNGSSITRKKRQNSEVDSEDDSQVPDVEETERAQPSPRGKLHLKNRRPRWRLPESDSEVEETDKAQPGPRGNVHLKSKRPLRRYPESDSEMEDESHPEPKHASEPSRAPVSKRAPKPSRTAESDHTAGPSRIAESDRTVGTNRSLQPQRSPDTTSMMLLAQSLAKDEGKHTLAKTLDRLLAQTRTEPRLSELFEALVAGSLQPAKHTELVRFCHAAADLADPSRSIAGGDAL